MLLAHCVLFCTSCMLAECVSVKLLKAGLALQVVLGTSAHDGNVCSQADALTGMDCAHPGQRTHNVYQSAHQ